MSCLFLPFMNTQGQQTRIYSLTLHGMLLNMQVCPNTYGASRRFFAEIEWKQSILAQNPNAFIVHFFPGDRADRKKHDSSPTWKKIRREVFKAVGRACQACGGKATQVHHRDYRPRVLSGEDLLPLVALCRPCHINKVHGGKEDSASFHSWNESERILANLIATREGAGLTEPGTNSLLR